MRLTAAGLALFVAVPCAAQIQLTIHDCRKVISNLGAGSRRTSDLAWLAKQRDRRSKYDLLIEHYSDAFEIHAVLGRAVIQVESIFDSHGVAHFGALVVGTVIS